MPEPIEEEYCCIQLICCGGANKRQAKKFLASKLVTHVNGINPAEAKRVADWILDTFDLATVGTLLPLTRSIAEMARAYPYTHDGN